LARRREDAGQSWIRLPPRHARRSGAAAGLVSPPARDAPIPGRSRRQRGRTSTAVCPGVWCCEASAGGRAASGPSCCV